jgi:sugar phosphate isomerase/epimerase
VACSTPPSSGSPPTPRARCPPATGFWYTDVQHWTEFLRALAEVDPTVPSTMAVNIEHEDANYSRLDGFAIAAENLRAVAAKV